MIRVSLLILAAVLTAALPGAARADPLPDVRTDPVVAQTPTTPAQARSA
jgi:hypothetical protein